MTDSGGFSSISINQRKKMNLYPLESESKIAQQTQHFFKMLGSSFEIHMLHSSPYSVFI